MVVDNKYGLSPHVLGKLELYPEVVRQMQLLWIDYTTKRDGKASRECLEKVDAWLHDHGYDPESIQLNPGPYKDYGFSEHTLIRLHGYPDAYVKSYLYQRIINPNHNKDEYQDLFDWLRDRGIDPDKIKLSEWEIKDAEGQRDSELNI